jgi:hypothetical protein
VSNRLFSINGTGMIFHAARRSNLHLAKKISFHEASRFTAVAGDRNSGGSDGNCTSSSNTPFGIPTTVPEPAVLGNVNTGTQPGTDLGVPNALAPGSQQPSVEDETMKATAFMLANAAHAAKWIPMDNYRVGRAIV